jgi:hypothetical protein
MLEGEGEEKEEGSSNMFLGPWGNGVYYVSTVS